jgi:hypothetical protein
MEYREEEYRVKCIDKKNLEYRKQKKAYEFPSSVI